MRHISTKRAVLGLASAILMVMTWFVDGEVQDDQIKTAVKEELEKLKLATKEDDNEKN